MVNKMRREVKEYVLKIYDTELVRFAAKNDIFGELEIEIKDVNEKSRNLFPMPLIAKTTNDTVKEWLKGRTIPKNRQFVNEILATAGLTYGDTLGIIDVCKGLSINDSFWVDEVGKNQQFANINLFENELDEALALVAYTGVNSKQKHDIGLSTEWTMSGQFPKAWRRIDGRLILYKGGTEYFANAGMEPYSEYFASQLANAMGIDAISYGLDKWKGKLASTCELFNTKDISFVPFWQVTGESRFPRNLTAGLVIDEDIFETMRTMTVFDALICNVDRHAGNYGFMRDNKTGNVLGFAPLFDHNLSLFARDLESDFKNWSQRANEVMLPRTSNLTFIEECKLVMGEKQHEMLRKVIGFKFINHDKYSIQSNRLDALNSYLENRVSELLQIPVVDEKILKGELAGLIDKKNKFVLDKVIGNNRPYGKDGVKQKHKKPTHKR